MEKHKTYIEAKKAAEEYYKNKYKYKQPVQIESEKNGMLVFYCMQNPKLEDKYKCLIEI